MRIYRTIGSLNKFYNIKLNQLEDLDLSEMERIRSNDPSYKGWVIQFFREIPNDFLLELSRSRFIFLILKSKKSNQYYAIVSIYPSENENKKVTKPFGKHDYNYIRNKLINMHLKRKRPLLESMKKGYIYGKRHRKKTDT